MPKEISTLIRYNKEGSKVVAVFYDRAEQKFFSLAKEECEERLRDAISKGYLHDQTRAALNGWPKQ